MSDERILTIKRELIEFCKKHNITLVAHERGGIAEISVCEASTNVDPFDYGEVPLFASDIFSPEGSKKRYA